MSETKAETLKNNSRQASLSNILRSRTFLLLFLFSFFVLFFNLQGRTVENKDYVRYPEISHRILELSDWTVMHLNGRIYDHKPPFHFWSTTVAYRIFGVNAFAARVPSALSALLSVLLYLFSNVQMGVWTGKTCLFSIFRYYYLSSSNRPDPDDWSDTGRFSQPVNGFKCDTGFGLCSVFMASWMPVVHGAAPFSSRANPAQNRTAMVRDPYAWWCGRRETVRLLPIPILTNNRKD